MCSPQKISSVVDLPTDDQRTHRSLYVQVQLKRPGVGVANAAGDLVLVPLSRYDFAEKK